MRPFEIILLGMNLLAVLSRIGTRARAVRLGIVGLNLLALGIHRVVEGFRYQMACSYGFVVLLVIYTLARTSGRFSKVRVPKALLVIGISLSVLLLAFTAFLSYALPVFTLPKPTGNCAVGIKYFPLVDENRQDPFLKTLSQKRELMIKMYYPAKQDDSKPFSPYFHASLPLMHAWAAFYHMPGFIFDHFQLIRTHSKDDLEPSDQQPSYPVILFSNGAGTSLEVETSQSEGLASHGYIVVDIDHPYVSAATVFPDRIVTAQEATRNFDTPEPAEPITQIMADDDKFVIKTLGEINDGRIIPGFEGKIDLGEVGVIGHSVGGAVAYNMALNDSRIKAAVNLDGAVYVVPQTSRAIAPFLMIANDKYHIQAIEKRENLMMKFDASPSGQQEMLDMYGSKKAYQAQYDKAQRYSAGLADVLKASGDLYTVEGSDHMKFTDIGLFIGSRWLRGFMQIGGKTDSARCLEITQAVTVAFFNQHLKGKTADDLTSLVKIYPELRRVQLTSISSSGKGAFRTSAR